MKKTFILLIILGLVSFTSFAQTGIITGTVNDGEYNDILPFANVIIKGQQLGALSGFEGKYSIELEPGTYTVQFSFVGYQTQEINEVIVTNGETIIVDVTLKASTAKLDEVVITTSLKRSTESSVLHLQRNSIKLMDGLSLESIKNSGASDMASAVKNIPGVSVQSGKYVYVRGLGDRYTKTSLNGVDVPGLDPNRNTLQLDLFPSSILENVMVSKSSTADQGADFTGGAINIVTKDIPNREEYSTSLGLGYNPDFHFNENYLSYDGSKTDFLGFDNGLRDNPIPTDQYIPLPQENGEVVEILTKRFTKNLAAQKETSFMDYNFSFTAGNQFDIGNNKLGYVASLSYRNETAYYSEYIDGQTFRKDIDPSNYELNIDRTQQGEGGINNVLISGIAGLSFKTEKSKYKFNLLHIQNGESQASIFNQQNRIQNSNQIKKDNLIYTQRSITNLLLNGKHSIGQESNWTLDWKLSPSLALVNDKDFRVTPFKVSVDELTGEETYTIEPSEAGLPTRIYRNLEEGNIVSNIDLTNKHAFLGKEAKLKFGGDYTYKTREFVIEKFSFPLLNIVSDFANGDPDQILADENIYDASLNSGVFVRRDSGISDTYDSQISVSSAYASEEFKITDWFQAVVGLRFEKFQLSYTGERQDGTKLDKAKILNKSDFFPSANLIFDLNEEGSQKIRTSYARTTARPSFKEASLAEIFDPINNTFFIGNINVQPTYINNFDLRYEKYGEKGDFYSISGFYKSFKDPIELSFIRSATGQFTPLNLGDAIVYGGEIEIRKNLGFISGWEDFRINANFSLIESQQEFSEDERANREDNLRVGEVLEGTRPLQGQSPFLVNFGIDYSNEQGWNAGFFYNVQGKTLQIVGSGDIPDVYTLPFNNLLFNASKSFGENKNSTISLKFENLLNNDIESVYESYNAEDEIYSKWNPGQKISLSYSIKF
ncbi:MAG: hypothetical protein ACI93N_000596 [Flavobacteriaceae bacterium]|jgi:hypothetical protein